MSDITRDLIFPTPIFHGKIWGGRKLETEFGYEIPDGPIGECWAISAHPNGDCVVAGGAWDGKHLSELWDEHRELFGGVEGDRFPLLVKIIDAKDNLSVQVHPDDAYANAHEGGKLGKTVLKASSAISAMLNGDTSHLARMLTEGYETGIVSLQKCINELQKSHEEVPVSAKELLKTYDKNIRALRKFL